MLTAEGLEVVKCGSHEARVYNAVDSTEGTPQAQIMVCVCVHVCVCPKIDTLRTSEVIHSL